MEDLQLICNLLTKTLKSNKQPKQFKQLEYDSKQKQ